MSPRDQLIAAAWIGGSLAVLICTFCFTRSPLEIVGSFFDWATEHRPTVKRAKYKYNGRRRYVEETDAGLGNTPVAAGEADGGEDSTEEEIAA